MEKRPETFKPEMLEEFKELLLKRRKELIDSEIAEQDESRGSDPYAGRGSVSSVPTHLADLASDSFDQDMRMRMTEHRNRELVDIDYALDRMKDGTYGICEITSKPIEVRRLRVVPWARYSLEGQEILEREGMPGSYNPRPVWREAVYEDSDSDTESDSD